MSRTNEDTKTPRGNFRGKHTPGCGYQPMNHWVVCDSCGFDIRAEDIKETWDHRLVCPSDWEPRHPQDFVRSRKDDMSAKGPVRPPPSAEEGAYECVTTPGTDSSVCNIAICNMAICNSLGSSSTVCTPIVAATILGPGIPSGTFNPDTL